MNKLFFNYIAYPPPPPPGIKWPAFTRVDKKSVLVPLLTADEMGLLIQILIKQTYCQCPFQSVAQTHLKICAVIRR